MRWAGARPLSAPAARGMPGTPCRRLYPDATGGETDDAIDDAWTSRERFWRTARFQPADRLPFWADWLGPAERWRQEGLPIDVDPQDGDAVRAWFVRWQRGE